MNYFLGFLAGMCDRHDWPRMSGFLMSLPGYNGKRVDGFDTGVEP
jgi:hypothetical protein